MKNIFIFSLILFNTFLYSQSDPYSLQERFRFGKYLFDSGDFLRAYEELNYYSTNDTARLLAAVSLSELGRFSESNDRLRSLSFNSDLSQISRFMLYKNAWFSDDNYFLQNNRSTLYFPKTYSDSVQSLANMYNLLRRKNLSDSEKFLTPFAKNYKDTIRGFYNSVVYPKAKNPVKAAWLSTIIPGAGKIYTEDYGDGITAFLFVGVLTYLAVDNFNADHDFRGYLFSALSAYFYAGNIYGSYSSAQIFNMKYRTSIDNDIKKFLESVNYFQPDLW